MLDFERCVFGEFYQVCRRMREIYCDERDHLIKRKEVNGFKLRILNIDKNTRTLLENVSRFDGKTNLEVNGYRSIVRVTRLMMELCLEEGQEIITRIKNLNTFKKYLEYWTAPLNAIDNIFTRYSQNHLIVIWFSFGKNDFLYFLLKKKKKRKNEQFLTNLKNTFCF